LLKYEGFTSESDMIRTYIQIHGPKWCKCRNIFRQ